MNAHRPIHSPAPLHPLPASGETVTAADGLADTQAEQIAAICTRELTGLYWSDDARGDLREIRSAALGVIDHEAGHEGFAGAHAELERRVTDWAENVDYRTFPRLTDEQLVALSVNQRKFGRENRRAGGR